MSASKLQTVSASTVARCQPTGYSSDEPDIDYDESPPFEGDSEGRRPASPLLTSSRNQMNPAPSSPVLSRQQSNPTSGSQSPRPKSFLFKKPATVGGSSRSIGGSIGSVDSHPVSTSSSFNAASSFIGGFAVIGGGPKPGDAATSLISVTSRQPAVARTAPVVSAWNSANLSDRTR